MARNEEKAMSLFNKWQTFKKDYHAGIRLYLNSQFCHIVLLCLLLESSNRRPLMASDCQSLPEAEKWRRELVRDLTRKIAAIQNGIVLHR